MGGWGGWDSSVLTSFFVCPFGGANEEGMKKPKSRRKLKKRDLIN